MDMVNELLGIQYNIAKANRTDRKVQNLAPTSGGCSTGGSKSAKRYTAA